MSKITYFIFVLLSITVSTTVSQCNNETIMNNIQSIFGNLVSPPTIPNLQNLSSTPIPINDTEYKVENKTYIYTTRPTQTVAPTSACECIPYYLCKENGTLNMDGEGLFTIRIDDEDDKTECPHYLLQCCPKTNISSTVILPKPLPKRKGCGYRRPKGIAINVDPHRNQAKYGELPWMIAVFTQDLAGDNKTENYKCGGALIHPKAVLTAAHCIENDLHYIIRAGEWDTKTNLEIYPHENVAVKEKIIHEHFYYGGLHNDVAILILEREIPYKDHIDVICLPPQDFVPDDNSGCIASGWGKKNFEKHEQYQTILKKINLPFVERNRCQDWLRTTRLGPYFMLDKSLVCAGGRKGEDTCEGDGGSPLVCPIPGQLDIYYQIGMVAWGIDCGNEVPAAYVNVALFRNWIDDVMKKNNLDWMAYEHLPISVRIDD
ncbi:phenoloxidase-activating factor 2-like [Onthophagus taurus]|uniref:phenoloxidase-activating factor 2-like n=1 Tax=Onthophagus taurus TaxID=166361 RepID=UPI0039BE2FFE